MTDLDDWDGVTPQLLDKVTHDAVLLIPPGCDYDAPDVRDIRRGGIHGSDIPAIVGESKRKTPRSVWHEKHDGLYLDDDRPDFWLDPGFWGQQHEPKVAEVWARKHGINPAELVDVGTLVNVDQPWMRAQVDRLTPCPDVVAAYARGDEDAAADALALGLCAVEVKCRSAHVASRWVDDIPDDVLAQVAWQRRVTGLHHVHIACLIDGNHLVEFRYDRNDTLERHLVVEAGTLWDRVLSHDPPDIDYAADVRALLAKLFPDRTGERELDRDEYPPLLAAWQMYVASREQTAALKAAATGKVLEALGAAEVLTFGGDPVWTYRAHDRAAYTVAAKQGIRSLRGPT